MADISVTLFGKRLRNPVMNASGTLGYGAEIEPFWPLDTLGAHVSKGLSALPHHGNPQPRIWEDRSGLMNSIGLQNIGVHRFFEEVFPLFKKRQTPVIVNFFGFSEDEYAQCAEAVPEDDFVCALEMNLSCPNIKQGGICMGKNPDDVYRVVRRIKGVTRLPLLAKLTPEVANIVDIARAAYEAGADGVTVFNTLPATAIDIEGKRIAARGGLSGPFLKPIALRAVADIASSIPIPVIGTGGIMDASDAIAFIMAGAAAVQVGTATLIDPFAIPKIVKGIGEYLDSHHISGIDEIKGRAFAQNR